MSASLSKLSAVDQPDVRKLIMRLVREQVRPHWLSYLFALLLMATAAAATAASAYLIGDVINAAYVDKDLPLIITIASIAAGMFAMKGLAAYGGQVQLARIGNRIVAESQRTLFAAMIKQNLSFFADRHSSEFMTRLSTGATAASQVVSLLMTAIGRDLLSLIFLVGVMISKDPIMAFFSFVVVPPALIVLRKMIRRIYSIARNQFHGTARIMETLQETVQGMRTVKAFTLEDLMRQRLEGDITAFENESNKWARVAHRASPLMESLGGVAIALALIYGGYRVIETGAKPGQFFAFLAAFMLAYEPAKRLARLNIELNSGLVGVKILHEIIDTPPTEPSDIGKPELALTSARVEFNKVDFAYRSPELVLKALSFVAEPGKVTALVGPSGGGKSTVFNLMLRFYEVGRGAITIDGQDIATVSRASLRGQIAYVGQDVFLFHGTIRENIALGRQGASDAEIIAAAKAAHAHEFISAFPGGYDTSVGERGTQISGGERQRIAIARALIKNAPIILLDEPTASLDSESERLVQDAIAHLCQGRTTLVIAHRLHTITHADRILVMEDGTISESGRHQELLRKNGRYADFYRLQFKAQEHGDWGVELAPSK